MVPVASRHDKDAKIHAFKLHRAVLPVLKKERWLIPLAVEEFFGNGNIDEAVRHDQHRRRCIFQHLSVPMILHRLLEDAL